MTYGGSEFIKMIQKNSNNMYIFLLVLGGLDSLPPGVKITRVGGQDILGQLAPRGASCPGGKTNWDTGCHEFLVSWLSTDFTDVYHQYPHICVCGEGDVYYMQRLGHYLGLKFLI